MHRAKGDRLVRASGLPVGNGEYSVSSVGSAEFGWVTAFRHNRVKWATRAEPDTTKQIAPTYFKQKVIMLKKFCVLF